MRYGIAKLDKYTGLADPNWKVNAYKTGDFASVKSITISGNYVFVGGDFSLIEGNARNNIAKLDISSGQVDINWNPNANGIVNTIATNNNDIYVGGEFTVIDGQQRNFIAKLSISISIPDFNWDPNANGIVNTIAIDGDNIYIGGNFALVSGWTRPKIAKLNSINSQSDNWKPNPNDNVNTITINNKDVYVGGIFTRINGELQSNFAFFTDKIFFNELEKFNIYNFDILPNYPNPFNPITTISFIMPQAGNATIKVYNSIGEEIATLLNERVEAGMQQIHFNAGNLPSGVYFYTVNTEYGIKTAKMMLVK
ncbi:MAG TPA: T9SS type A sorting domain-containing protein [Ignavibacteriales bacterium]|nr:T9SS type A sorting domain-containing protein [Ignavibacteriales bacterium]HPD67492.1 T9SS type A sorting domain-containing protein [Ignavibacteriales bacterium]